MNKNCKHEYIRYKCDSKEKLEKIMKSLESVYSMIGDRCVGDFPLYVVTHPKEDNVLVTDTRYSGDEPRRYTDDVEELMVDKISFILRNS